MNLKEKINEDVKATMRAKDSSKLAIIRLLTAAIKQEEVDKRIELDDAQVLSVIDKMLKQRRDSIAQFEAGGRQDLADKEKTEIGVLSTYMPAAMSEDEIATAVAAAIASTGATVQKDMGRVMAILKPKMAGRADMTSVSAKVKAALAAA